MIRAGFVEHADLLTERQAQAFWHRRIEGKDRQTTADIMETSPSNVDNLERAAHQKIIKAQNTLNLLDGVGYEYEGEVGVCSECDTPTDTLSVHPEDYDEDLEDARMVCPDCS